MEELTNRFNKLAGAFEEISTTHIQYVDQQTALEDHVENVEKAREAIKTVALQTQKQLELHISSIVSLALSAVFDDPYALTINFVERRGKTEADIKFVRNGQEIDPLSSSGGGAINIACMALRMSLWSLQPIKTRPLLVLDEPFRDLSLGLQEKAGKMIKMLSDKLGVQFIIVSHKEAFIESADSVFEVTNKKGVSCVRT